MAVGGVDTPIGGDVADGFGTVADEFRRNFAERGEVGAAVAAYHEGKKIVDLWGGHRDGEGRLPWERDTMVTVFSATKGMAAVAVHVAHARGWFGYDDLVAEHWPEFGRDGKEAVTVRQLLAHQAGLPFVDEDLDFGTMANPDAMASVLARQTPVWVPGTRHGYHAVTIGWHEGELIRRVDPRGRTLGRFFADEVAGPLDADFHIGVPANVSEDRIATVLPAGRFRALLTLHRLPLKLVAALLKPRSVTARTLMSPRQLFDTRNWNRRELREMEIPASNGTGEVRAVARIYGIVAAGGAELGLDPETLTAMEERAPGPAGGLEDAVLRYDRVYSLGYSKPHRIRQRSPRVSWFGTDAGRAFGSAGVGGSFGFADPDVGIGFAYAPNRHGVALEDDPRERALRRALYRSLPG